jgi:NodT family efflux transporter outer membrane factor (OMF) lipoprotein
MRVSLIQALCATISFLSLTGCMVGPDFLPPPPELPHTSFLPGNKAYDDIPGMPRPTNPAWWSAFHDPILTSLEARVGSENLDVQTATVRLAQSRFQRGITAASLFPTINGDAKYTRELYSQNGIASLLGTLGGATGGATPIIPPIDDYNVGFDASWELDLWGKVRRQVENADASFDQAENQRRDALVSSLAELARDYIQLRGTQVQIAIAQRNAKVADDILKLAKERQEKGVQSALDVENAAAQLENVRAQIPNLQQQESQYINALSLLLNEPPGTMRHDLGTTQTLPVTPPRIGLGIPSDLARRRPDIRAAEASLHAATANIGAAVGEFYPSIQLNGTVGLDALQAKNLFKASSLQYTAGPSISLPIFAAGKISRTVELREAQQIEAAIYYHKTVLQAWHEVANAIVAYHLEQTRHSHLTLEAGHAREALSLARQRYTDGVTDFLTVLDDERTVLQAEQNEASSATTVALDLVQLFKALGGGWETVFPDHVVSIAH